MCLIRLLVKRVRALSAHVFLTAVCSLQSKMLKLISLEF
jgi:hypothetical protein